MSSSSSKPGVPAGPGQPPSNVIPLSQEDQDELRLNMEKIVDSQKTLEDVQNKIRVLNRDRLICDIVHKDVTANVPIQSYFTVGKMFLATSQNDLLENIKSTKLKISSEMAPLTNKLKYQETAVKVYRKKVNDILESKGLKLATPI